MDEPLASKPPQDPIRPSDETAASPNGFEFLMNDSREPESIIFSATQRANRLRGIGEKFDTGRKLLVVRPGFLSLVLVSGLVAACAGLTLLNTLENRTLSAQFQKIDGESAKLSSALVTLARENGDLTSKYEKVRMQNKELEAALSELEQNTESVHLDMQKYEMIIDSIQEEKTYLEEMLINKTKDVERLKKYPQEATASSTDELADKIRLKDEEIKRLAERNQVLLDKLDTFYRAVNEKISEISVAKITLEETLTNARKALEAEWSAVNLGSISLGAGANAARPPKTEGRVLAVNQEHGFVVVDLGRADNLTTGSILSVTRSGQAVATLSVLESRDTMAACNIKELQPGSTIAMNDTVAIR